MASIDVVQLSSETYATEYYNSQPYDEITLEYVSGVSCKSKSAIDANPCNGNIAFVASSVLVLSDPQYPNQAFIENPTAREIGCVTFSGDGRFLAYGEFGLNPSVAVFNAKHFTQVNTFQVHEGKCSIKALQFHPRSIYLAILLAYDYGILVYEFVHGRKLAAAKWCVEPLAMTMTRTDCMLAVCGHRKVGCFSLSNVESTRYETNAMLDRRAVLLGKHGNYTFVDIVSGQNRFIKCIYTVTSCGVLCEIKAGVIKDVLKVSNRCFCVKFSLGLLFIGCENGMVNICNPETLKVVACIDDNDLFGRDQRHPTNWSIKSDIMALVINQKTKIVTTLMANQKLHSWHIKFVDDGFECAPVIVSESATDNKNQTSKMVTTHDLNCTLAQLLIQLEISNRSQKNKKTNFLQRQPTSRFRQFNAIKITPDGKDIILGNRSGEIKVYEATTGTLKKVIEAHNAEVTFVEVMYDKDFKLVATGGRDRVIFILNAQKDYRLVQAITDHASAIVSISLAHNNGILTLVSSSKDGVILIRRAPKEETPKFITIGELPECVGSKKRSYNHSSGYIITGQEKGRINVFPFDPHINLKPITKIQVGNAFLKSVAIDPTSSFFVAFGTEGQYVFHLQTGQQIATLCYLPGFNHLSFSQDLNYFINSNDAGCKFLWRLPTKIIEVMHANLKDISSMVVTSREFIFNSYMSCVRVCQHLVGEDEDGSTSTIKASREGGSTTDIAKFDNFTDENRIVVDGNATFPLIEKKNSHMTITEKGQEIMNFLCEDHHMGLVETASYTSCCTTYSRSLTDVAPIMDLSSDGLGGSTVKAKSPVKPETKTNALSTDVSKADDLNRQNIPIDVNSPDADRQTVNVGSTPTYSSSFLNTTCQSVDLGRGVTAGHEADCEDYDETSIDTERKKSPIGYRHSVGKLTVPSSNHSGRDGGTDYGTALAQQVKTDSARQPGDKAEALGQDSDTLITTREKLNTTCTELPTPGSTVDGVSLVEAQTQWKESEKMDNTSHMKDSGVVEDLATDYTLVDTHLEDSSVKRSLKSSPKSADVVQSKALGTGKRQDENRAPHRQTSKDAISTNDISHTSSAAPTASAIPDDDLDSLKNNLESLRDLEDNGQLQEYYTEFCRNIHLSNSQETYVLKETGDFDFLNLKCCFDDHGHNDTSGRHDSGKGSPSITYGVTNTTGSTDHSEIPSSIETRLFGPSFPSKDGQTGQRDFDLYQHDVNLRRVFLSWVRRKLNKERKRKKQLKSMGQSPVHRQDHSLKGISQDAFPSETMLEEISTTDTDFVTTESNVTWASNTSVCRGVLSNVNNEDDAHMPAQTLSEPIAASRCNAMPTPGLGLMQWQRSFHYTSSSVHSRTTSYSPTRSSGNSLTHDMSQKSSFLVSGRNDAADDYSNSSVSVGDHGGSGGGGGGGGVVVSRKSEKFCQASSIMPKELVQSLSHASAKSPRKSLGSSEKFGDSIGQAGTGSFTASPTMENAGGMASLFRNQDDYLRKLKEVRRNFEKSIQELSNERKNQQIEAQKYLMKH